MREEGTGKEVYTMLTVWIGVMMVVMRVVDSGTWCGDGCWLTRMDDYGRGSES